MLFKWYFLEFTFGDILDILSVTFFFYILIYIVKQSKVISMTLGIIIIVLIWVLSGILNLTTLNWIFSKIIQFGVFALLIVFQPELRSALVRLGNFSFLDLFIDYKDENIIDEVILALKELQEKKMGALIVFERKVSLASEVSKGVIINAEINHKLLVSIFFKDNPLHDGAVIIRGNKIVSAASILPLADIPEGFSAGYYNLGLRHRAAIGITEDTDAISVVLSEETQRISVCQYGQLKPMTLQALKVFLNNQLLVNMAQKGTLAT